MTIERSRRAPDTSARVGEAVAWKVHPAIGFARVGNSPSEYFVARDATGPDPNLRYRDNGDSESLRLPGIKKHAAAFRVFAYDRSGSCLGEATADPRIRIDWTVTLANKKSSGPRIGGISNASRLNVSRPRNPHVPMEERWRLEITPQPRHVYGAAQRAVFDDGRFMDHSVCLGEIQTDLDGRLVVLGGAGHAGTYDSAKRITSTTDNDYWYDDISDGPVDATVVFPDGKRTVATPAWVIVTPPDYTPGVSAVATQFDVLVDYARRRGLRAHPGKPGFRDDILPLLRRILAMQWLNREALASFADEQGGIDLKAMLPVLARNDDRSKFARRAVLNAITNALAAPDASRWLDLTATQLLQLELWAAGDFKSDTLAEWNKDSKPESTWSDPRDIDRRALETCAGSWFLVDAGDIFMSGDDFRIDHRKVSPGSLTQVLPCPWHANFLEPCRRWALVNRPEDVQTTALLNQVSELDAKIASTEKDSADDEDLRVLRQRRHDLWTTRERWTRGLPETFPARAESLVKEWQHLGFVAPHRGPVRLLGAPAEALVEQDRCPHLGSLADYFHRLVNFEENLDFAPKALEMAHQFLGDAKFGADELYAGFRYTPAAFDERLDRIYGERVREVMYNPVAWESGRISWAAVADYHDDDEPAWKRRRFNVGRFSDAALRERFRQFAPENLTDGAWLQNITSAAPMAAVQSRLTTIWFDEVGGGHMALNHANVYAALMQSLNIYMPPVTSREFVDQDFVPSAFLSPVFQFSIGRFPKRFLPELLGMTLFMEWEATPVSTAIANMMAERQIDPQYYRMHAGIDNVNSGHGALAKEAVKLYLDAKQQEGGEAVVQEHWQRIWRGYVAWGTLGNGHDEVVERMMLVDRKQIQNGPSLLARGDIRLLFLRALRNADDPVSRHLRSRLDPKTREILATWNGAEPPSDAVADIIREDLNRCLREGIHDADHFASVRLTADTSALLERQLQHHADVIDLGRSLLEDAYPDGIARRTPFPDVRQYYTGKMKALINRRASVAKASHRRVGWLNDAFGRGAEAVMEALLKRGFIDLENPRSSRLFGKTEFGGPMFKVFSEDDEKTIIEWIESLRIGMSQAIRPESMKTVTQIAREPDYRRRKRQNRLREEDAFPAPEPDLPELEPELGVSSIY